MNNTHQSIAFKIEGMTCASCAYHARRALEGLDGVHMVSIDSWHKGNAEVEALTGSVTSQQITQALQRAGYKAVIEN